MIEQRRSVFQSFAWFNDLFSRTLLDLSPPYQRRSVWNDEYKAFFLDTVLNNYPCPAIFLFEEITPEGTARYKVVDGKQRLSTLLDFVRGQISISEDASIARLRGKKFDELETEEKLIVWRYQFCVEFISQENETIINNIFDRINRNVAKLTFQELRHARLSGVFISEAEECSQFMLQKLPVNFPNISPQSKRQMKDVEIVATLFLFLEQGEASTSQSDLDAAFVERDSDWEKRDFVIPRFKQVIEYISQITAASRGSELASSRLKNQADFYSLFGAIAELVGEGALPSPDAAAQRLLAFVESIVSSDGESGTDQADYISAARSASNDKGPRRRRIDVVKSVLIARE